MEALIKLLSLIPNVIWSAVIASCLTILGVLLTNKGNANRQTALLAHETQKYQSEQKLALKKEVFLNVAASFSDVLEVIPKLMNLEFSQKDIATQTHSHSGIVAKAYLAAKEESVSEILNYSAETAEVLLDLLKDRSILLDHKKAIEIYDSTIDAANNEKNRIVSMMQELKLQGRNDPETFDYLNNCYATQNKIVEESTQSKEEQEKQLEPLHKAFMKKCISDHSRLLSMLPPMTIALRSELGNDENAQLFVNSLDSSIKRMNKAFDRLV